MTQMTLTKTRLHAGTWEGLLAVPADAPPPRIEVLLRDERVDDVQITKGQAPDTWVVRVPVPVRAISDGIQVFLIRDTVSGQKLNEFVLLAGEVVSDAMQAEVALLRAELDMLKRAFRRHCVETMG